MKVKAPLVTAEQLAELVHIDQATGLLTWKPRAAHWFHGKTASEVARIANSWNALHPGRAAFAHSSGNGYLHGCLFGIKHYAHRIVWALAYGAWPTAGIDHINGDKRDNRMANLRDVVHAENCRNQPISKANTSGATGVSFDRRRGAWEAYINVGGKKLNLGRFETVAEATNARRAANEAHGFHPNHGRNAA